MTKKQKWLTFGFTQFTLTIAALFGYAGSEQLKGPYRHLLPNPAFANEVVCKHGACWRDGYPEEGPEYCIYNEVLAYEEDQCFMSGPYCIETTNDYQTLGCT